MGNIVPRFPKSGNKMSSWEQDLNFWELGTKSQKSGNIENFWEQGKNSVNSGKILGILMQKPFFPPIWIKIVEKIKFLTIMSN